MELIMTIDFWISALEDYDIDQLRTQPSPGSWSMGQLYTHLLLDTGFYLEQVKSCIDSGANAEEPLTEKGNFLLIHGFPDIRIEGHPDNQMIPQPETHSWLLNKIKGLRSDIERAGKMVDQTNPIGKTRHPDTAIGYFSAGQWLQFANKHFEHHLRQKKRIDLFLGAV